MDYRAFYGDIVEWIYQNQSQTELLGFGSHEYISWVFKSAGQLADKYENNELVTKQLCMLLDWIETKLKEQGVN